MLHEGAAAAGVSVVTPADGSVGSEPGIGRVKEAKPSSSVPVRCQIKLINKTFTYLVFHFQSHL